MMYESLTPRLVLCAFNSQWLTLNRNGLNVLPSFYNTINLNTAGESANTGIIWVGGCVSGFFSGFILDKWGRKSGMAAAVFMTAIGIILQSAAMFLIGRLIVGIGVGLSSVACPTYVSEVSQLKWRAFSLGFYYDFWYGGGIIVSAITYGTAKLNSSWAWRIPSILQIVPSLLCLLILPFIPESPRWFMYKGRQEEARGSWLSWLLTVISSTRWSSLSIIRLPTQLLMRNPTPRVSIG